MPAQNSTGPKISSGASTYWRELLFWLLLVPALKALGSDLPKREAAGVIEACGFFLIAYVSLARPAKESWA